jgi:hypothetical protein
MHMMVAIHQPNYLPWLGYFRKIFLSDAFVFLDSVQFEKNGYTNRVKIKTPNGGKWLTVPVATAGKPEQLIKDVEPLNSAGWSEKHWKTLEQNYKKAPFFGEYAPKLKKFYEKDWSRLADFNIALAEFICKEIGLSKKFVRSSELRAEGKSSELLAGICRKLGATKYLSGEGAKSYTDEQVFKNSGIELVYSPFKHPIYPQLHGEFVPKVSFLDALLNVGKEAKSLLSV